MHLTDLLSPLAGRWLKRVQSELDVVPRPVDAPRRVSPGLVADRVLLLGNGPVIGFGVRTQELALPGQLARRLTAATGRGAVVDVLARRGLRVDDAAPLLATSRPGTYDAVVLSVGATDAAALTPVEQWRAGLGALLDETRRTTGEGTAVIVLPVVPLQRTHGTAGRRRHLSDLHASRLDEIAVELCAERGIDVVAADPASTPPRTPEQYVRLADRLVPALAHHLDRLVTSTSSSSARAQRRSPDPEVLRQAAVERSGLLDRGSDPALDRLVQQARDVFGAAAAAVTLIDGDRVVYLASAGLEGADAPRSIAPCNRTIRRDGAHVDADLTGEPVADHGWRFYAGHPLESPDGWRIGTLCVLDGAPRTTDDVDEVALVDLAARVQEELWLRIAEGAGTRAASRAPVLTP